MSVELSEYDILYSPSRWSKRFPASVAGQKHVELITKYSEEVQKQIKCDINISYGSGPRELLDIYGTDLADGTPIFIFIHGGFWQKEVITHNNSSFMAKNLYKNGIKSIYIGYELCPKVTVQEISRNIEKAVKKCLEYAKKHKSRGLYLSGHSAGAQLVAELFENFIPSLPIEDKMLFKSAYLLSGVYDLVPLVSTQINIHLKLDEISAKAVSPNHKKINAEDYTVFYIIVGEHDSPAFLEQGKRMTKYLQSLGIKTNFVFINNVDHFDIIERLTEEEYELTKLIINAIKH